MKEQAHQRTEEEIEFVFDHLGWNYSPIKLVQYLCSAHAKCGLEMSHNCKSFI